MANARSVKGERFSNPRNVGSTSIDPILFEKHVLITYRTANTDDIQNLRSLISIHGQNEWNQLTAEGIEFALNLFRNNNAGIIIAELNNSIIGLAMNVPTDFIPPYYSNYVSLTDAFFIGDVVVNRKFVGQGIGTALLEHNIEQAKRQRKKTVLIEHHENNLASATMIRKAGFKKLDSFIDTSRRPNGTQITVIHIFEL